MVTNCYCGDKIMEIEIHGFVVVVHNIDHEQIKELTNKILHIDYYLYSKSDFQNRLTLKYAFGKSGESVCIKSTSLNENGEFDYIIINLHGSFFDNSPNFKFEEFLSFLSKFKHTPKQLDVAFNDNDRMLTIENIIRWCNEPGSYCTGSLVRKHAPGVRYKKMTLDRIELNGAKSATNYASIYVRPDTGFIRFEIKFKSKVKIDYILDGYDTQNNGEFQKRSLRALVGCINFIRPFSKGKRNSAKDIKQDSWKSFLGSDINKVNWNKEVIIKKTNRFEADNYKSNDLIKDLAGKLQNIVSRASILTPEAEVLRKLSEYSGFIVSRNISASGSYHNYIQNVSHLLISAC